MKNLDFYGKPIELHLRGKYIIKTTIGGLLSILSFVLIILYSYLIGNDIFFHSNPSTYQEYLTSNQTYSFEVKPNEPEFYFNIFNGDKTPFNDPTYLKLKLVTKIRINSAPSLPKEIGLERCSRKNFPNYDSRDNFYNLYETIQTKEYFCPIFNETVDIYGSWIEPSIKIMQILVYPCNNKTDNVVCKSKEEIDDVIWTNRVYLSIYYPLISVLMNDYENPFKLGFKEDYYYLSKTNTYKFFTYSYELIELKTDNGLILSNETYLYQKSLNFVSGDVRNIITDDNFFFSIDIISSFNKRLYSRSYLKLTNILSQCGGMFLTIGSLCAYLSSLFTKLERTKILMKNFFLFRNPDLGFDDEFEISRAYNKFFNNLDDFRSKCKSKEFKENAVFNLKVNNLVKEFFLKRKKKNMNIKDAIKEMQIIFDISKKENIIDSFKNLKNSPDDYTRNINPMRTNLRKTIASFKKNHTDKNDQNNNKEFINLQNTDNNLNNLTGENLINEDILLNSRQAFSPLIKNNFYNDGEKKMLGKNLNYNEGELESDFNFKLNISPLKNDTLADIPNINKNYNDLNLKQKDKEYDEEEENIKYINRDYASLDKNNLNITNREGNDLDKINKAIERKSVKKNKIDIIIDRHNITRKRLSENSNKSKKTKYDEIEEFNSLDIENENADFSDYHKKFFIKLFELRSKPHKLYMTFWEQIYYNFFKQKKTKRSSIKNYKQKLFYLLDKTDKKIEEYFDFVNILENIEEAKILKHIILEDHQKDLINLFKRPFVYYEREDNLFIDSNSNIKRYPSHSEEKVNIHSCLDILFEKPDLEKIYNLNDVKINLNQNLINFIRKAD